MSIRILVSGEQRCSFLSKRCPQQDRNDFLAREARPLSRFSTLGFGHNGSAAAARFAFSSRSPCRSTDTAYAGDGLELRSKKGGCDAGAAQT
jgi:hypothetical protein